MQSRSRNKIKPITKAACCFSSVHAVGLLLTGKLTITVSSVHPGTHAGSKSYCIMEEADASLLRQEIKCDFIINLAAVPALSEFRVVSIKCLPTSQLETQMKTNPKIRWVYLLLRYAEAKIVMPL